MGEITRLHHPPSRHTSTNRGTLLFLPKTVRTEGNGESTWLVSGVRQRTGSANCRIRLPSSRAPTLLRAHLGALQDTRERCELRWGRRATCIRAQSRMLRLFARMQTGAHRELGTGKSRGVGTDREWRWCYTPRTDDGMDGIGSWRCLSAPLSTT